MASEALSAIERTAGAIVTVVVLLDVFLTVLYARAGIAVFSPVVAQTIWFAFRIVSRPFGRHRGAVLSFCGPVILVALIFVWAAGLALGSGLIMHPHLGAGIVASQGSTPRDFMSALYAGASSLSFVGASEFKPQSAAFQALYMLNSLIGISVSSLVLTYVMQIYNALRIRNGLGLALETLSDQTGDAAELIAGLGPDGQFSSGVTTLSTLAMSANAVKESHHFYPLLFYFRFVEPFYSVSRTATVLLDTVSLLKSGLSDEDYRWLKQSATVSQCWRAAMLLVAMLDEVFVSGQPAPPRSTADAVARERWRTRYTAALERLRQAGIKTIADPASGFETYVSLRERWDEQIVRLRTAMMYEADEIDEPTYCPEVVRARRSFELRLRDV
jgi:hypothetical protein